MVKLKVVTVLGGCWLCQVSAEQSRPTDHNLRPSVGSPELLSPVLAACSPLSLTVLCGALVVVVVVADTTSAVGLDQLWTAAVHRHST